MSTSLDLNLLPLASYAGQEHPELLGVYASEPPRRPARGRSADRLILYLTMVGNAPIPPGKQERILAEMADQYYKTSGSVTAGLRAVADGLNTLLLERNYRIANTGRQGVALFTQTVVRNKQLYLAVSGPIHAYLIAADETKHFYDPEMAGRGLGQSRTAPLSFFQGNIYADDTLLLAAQPAPDWRAESFRGFHGQGPQSFRRRIFVREMMDVNAVLIQAKTGKGRIYVPKTRSVSHTTPPPVKVEEQAVSPTIEIEEPPAQIETAPLESAPQSPEPLEMAPEFSPVGEISLEDSLDDQFQADLSGISVGETPPEGVLRPAEPRSVRRFNFAPVLNIFARIAGALSGLFQSIGQAFSSLFERLLPGELPSTTMAFIAIAVPVVIVTVASVVYFQLGRTMQYEALFNQALQVASQAAVQEDNQAQQAAWEQVIALVDQAQSYQASTDEADQLRKQAQQALDILDQSRRVDYQPAIVDGLHPSVSVVRMVISDSDLYLLDGTSGNVFRGQPTSQGYVLDEDFQCGPGPLGVSEIGQLIDIIPWPAGYTPGAAILALDDGGNVLYCTPDSPPKSDKLTPPESQNWGIPTAFTLDLGDLYVLDPLSNAVWIYRHGDVTQEPTMFFDENIPFLQDVIDLTAHNRELYLLHADGHVTLCYYQTPGIAPTRCEELEFTDSRPGREGTPMSLPENFTQLMFTPPPDPSLFFFAPQRQAIYHFSLRNLIFQNRYLPADPLPDRPATSFFVNPLKRTVYLAVGYQVYYGVLP